MKRDTMTSNAIVAYYQDQFATTRTVTAPEWLAVGRAWGQFVAHEDLPEDWLDDYLAKLNRKFSGAWVAAYGPPEAVNPP